MRCLTFTQQGGLAGMFPNRSSASRSSTAIGLYLSGILFQTIMDAAAKWLTADYPVGEVALARAFFALIPISILVTVNGGARTLRTSRIGMQTLSGLSMAATILLLFASFRVLPLADSLVLFFSGPLIMTLLAVVFLGEHAGRGTWGAIGLGFVGVLVILGPSGASIQAAGLLAVASAFTYAVAAVSTRSLVRTEPENSILFYSTAIVAVVGAATCFYDWVTPTAGDIEIFMVIGLAGAIGNLLLLRAFRIAQVKTLAPFDYTALVWAVVLGFIIWQELPTLWVWVGAGIIICTGVYVLVREANDDTGANRGEHTPA